MGQQDDYGSMGRLYHGDCLEILRIMPADSIDSVVTDPP
jgi:DNA modification methylase